MQLLDAILSPTSNLSLANSCHVEYYAGTNTLYLDSSSGGNNWVGHQPYGGAWVDANSNGICQVNSWYTVPNGNYLALIVSLTFQTPGTWYEFMNATNATGYSVWATNYLTWTAP